MQKNNVVGHSACVQRRYSLQPIPNPPTHRPRMDRYTIAPELAGSRLDQALPRLQPDLSRSYAQQLIDEGQVLVNGQKAKPSLRLKADDTVEIDIPPPAPVEITPEAIPLSVVYEDADVLVIDKPAGLV